jgi:putative FmdB family regulatory protein
MPLYEYACSSCGGRFDAVQKFSDPVLTQCRLCGAEGIRKVLAPPSFVLKGSGWYATDYPSADRKKGMESEKPAGAGEASKAPACASGACASGNCPSKG